MHDTLYYGSAAYMPDYYVIAHIYIPDTLEENGDE
jgi:hypothetical protein